MTVTADDPIAQLGRIWAGYARRVYADYPLYVALASAVASNRALLERLSACPPTAYDPNMFLACLQYLILDRGPMRESGATTAERRMAELYQEPLSPPEDVADRLAAFCRERWDEIAHLLATRHVQTNETGRCGGIALGLAAAADMIGEPLALLDAGASAGLNLGLDEYRLDFGGAGALGPADSPVRIACRLEGAVGQAPLRLPAFGARLGLDRTPVPVTDPDAVRWLLACIWPGRGRQERARAALSLAAAHPDRVRRADMVTGLHPALEELAPAPTAVLTTWSYSYLDGPAREQFKAGLAEHADRPLAWVCMDLAGTDDLFDVGPASASPEPTGEIPSVLGLAVFADRRLQSARPLAVMHSHGNWVRWL